MPGEVDTRPGVLRSLGVAMFAKLQRWPTKHRSKEYWLVALPRRRASRVAEAPK